MIGSPLFLAKSGSDLLFVWDKATIEGQLIIVVLVIFSMIAWMVMAYKATQMRRAKKLNRLFETEFGAQPSVFTMYDRRVSVEGCPLFAVYPAGCAELDERLRAKSAEARKQYTSLKSMEHVKRTLERTVAQESLRLEAGLILLAIAVSGAPFLGLLGTVWGVMSAFGHVAEAGTADLATMAPGVSGA